MSNNQNNKGGAPRADDRRDDKRDRDPVPQASTRARDEAPRTVSPAAEKLQTVYRVAPGKSITSGRGILDAGEVVREQDFEGDDAIGRLLRLGAIVAGT